MDRYQEAARIFAVLSDDTRVRLFWLLCHQEGSVHELASLTGTSSPAILHHLKQLRDSDLITADRIGRETHYKASDNERAQLLHHTIEKMIDIACPDDSNTCCSGCAHCDADGISDISREHRELIHEIHDYLTKHLDRRITIDELSHLFAMNPTSIKTLFREIYGKSVASHVKEHRMEAAAHLLSSTDLTMAEIAERIGYNSQSKFTAAFREYYGTVPTAYRTACRTAVKSNHENN